MRILILGITGMLGNALFRYLAAEHNDLIFGSIRQPALPTGYATIVPNQEVIPNIHAETDEGLETAFARSRPSVVINCIGVVKQLAAAEDPLVSIPINSLLPHRIAARTAAVGARVIHISTDCVFSGKMGGYVEADTPDASDLYGRSKLLGELYSRHAVTLRTSIIGHEVKTKHGLLEWFLAEAGSVQGYSKAIFSGLPTVELSRVIRDFVLPNPELNGLYHVGGDPISKLDLLRIISKAYATCTEIHPSERVAIDRSLNSDRFRTATGYSPPDWDVLVDKMRKFR